jgi:hypothetical protein
MISLLTSALILFSVKNPCNKCKVEKDTLTGKSIYVTCDVEPECKGGIAVLLGQINKTVFIPDSLVTGNFDSHYTVSFIVEADGQINGGRVIHDNTNQIGNLILKAVKNCRWIPGECNGKKVRVLYTYSTIIDIQKE